MRLQKCVRQLGRIERAVRIPGVGEADVVGTQTGDVVQMVQRIPETRPIQRIVQRAEGALVSDGGRTKGRWDQKSGIIPSQPQTTSAGGSLFFLSSTPERINSAWMLRPSPGS